MTKAAGNTGSALAVSVAIVQHFPPQERIHRVAAETACLCLFHTPGFDLDSEE